MGARGGRPGFGRGGPQQGRGGFLGFGGPGGGQPVFRAYRYSPDYPGLASKDLTPGKMIEALESKPAERKN
jgi:hypothetical protein